MSPKIKLGSLVFVIEMNNDINKIEGIGIIRNMNKMDKYYSIYDKGDYNRYVYIGNHYLSREELIKYNKQMIDMIEMFLFKGKTHLKRGYGMTMLTDKFMKKKKKDFDFEYELKDCFYYYYKSSSPHQNANETNK
jgi:hypothetical protein